MPECMKPFFVKDVTKSAASLNQKQRLVPCGTCQNCLISRASAWSFRLMQEEKVSTTAFFITLTYSSSNVPITRNGFLSLKKRDFQLFMKRLRKAHGVKNKPLKYYAVGEYGGKLKRPHYHIILFNADIALIQGAWGLGHIHYGKVEEASVGYTLKYISKPYKNFHINDDREKPFSLMSKGLGLNYLSKSMIKWHRSDMFNRMYCNLKDGKKCTMPRYYKERIYTDVEREEISKHIKNEFVEAILKDLLVMSREDYDRRSINRRNSRISAMEKFKADCINQ